MGATFIFWPSFLVSIPFLTFAWPKSINHLSAGSLRWGIKKWVGFVSLCLFLGWAQLAQHVLAVLGAVHIGPGIAVNAGSCLLFPLSVAALLYLYIADSPRVFRRVCVFLIGVNTLVAAATCLIRLGWLDVSSLPPETSRLYTVEATYEVMWGTLILLIDAVLLIFLLGQLKNRTGSIIGQLAIPLLSVLVFDCLLYALVVSHYERAAYEEILMGQLVSKLPVGAVYAYCLYFYFRLFEPAVQEIETAKAGIFLGEVFGTIPQRSLRRCEWRLTTSQAAATSLAARTKECDKQQGSGLVMGAFTETEALFREKFDTLLKDHRGKWVAFSGSSGVVAMAESFEELENEIEPLCLTPGSYVVHRLVPWLSLSLEISPERSFHNRSDLIGDL